LFADRDGAWIFWIERSGSQAVRANLIHNRCVFDLGIAGQEEGFAQN
jgi:hypothetical protein